MAWKFGTLFHHGAKTRGSCDLTPRVRRILSVFPPPVQTKAAAAARPGDPFEIYVLTPAEFEKETRGKSAHYNQVPTGPDVPFRLAYARSSCAGKLFGCSTADIRIHYKEHHHPGIFVLLFAYSKTLSVRNQRHLL